MPKKIIFEMKVSRMLGFSGNVVEGLCVHRDLEFIIYPLATEVVVENINSKEQYLLENDTPGEITALACSNSGEYLAAGYLPYPGFKAIINVWDFHSRQRLLSYDTHKDRVHTMKFSFCDDFIISVGGYGEDNSLICYSVKDKEIYCGSNAANNTSGDAFTLHIISTEENVFVTGGENTIRFWKFHASRKFLEFSDFLLSKYKRRINCMDSNEENTFLYCGTNSGDVLKIKLKEKPENDLLIENTALFGCFGKKINRRTTNQFCDAKRYVLGITAIRILNDDRLLIGSGNGTLEIVKEGSLDKINCSDLIPDKLISPTLPVFIKEKRRTFGSRITSVVVKKNQIFIGTEATEMFFIDLNDFKTRKFISSHNVDINDVVFPHDYSDVFATACGNSIELWSSEKCDKLLSIVEEGSMCNAIYFLHSGEALISVWNNGHIRIHTPETGKCIYRTEKPLKIEPTAISVTPNDVQIIIGDSSGEIQFWKNQQCKLSLTRSVKKHKSKINAISTSVKEDLVVSCGNEGLCIIWDLNEYCSRAVISCLTICHSVKFHRNEHDIITCGKDRKIRIWSLDGCLKKEIEASKHSVNCLDLTSDGNFIATGGFDLKIWYYDDKCKLIGVGQSADIFKVKFSPDQRTILTVCDKRRISVWKLPSDISN